MAIMSIGRVIGSLAEQCPHRPAITCEGRTVTWLELDRHTNRLARAYQHLGVAQNDLVTIGLPNGLEFYESALAIWKLGRHHRGIGAQMPLRGSDRRRAAKSGSKNNSLRALVRRRYRVTNAALPFYWTKVQ